MHIAVAGNIGSGKTTLTESLAKHYRWVPHYENVDVNPYLNDFYNDMQRWSFNLQIYFLQTRLQQILDIRKLAKTVIQDRTLYEDAEIFAPNLHSMGLMSTRDYNNYKSLFNLMVSLVKPPDLIIYLRASISTLVSQIQRRGREFENSIRLDYLNQLNERYEQWVANYDKGKLLVINIDNLDYRKNPEDLSLVIDKIDAQIHGLF
ncbi:MAG: deoxynucleoside kinase [Prolixibacteraceae bacterium]|nr:deoxynucleoside kinase [Prolixibacteraceae bacterium]MDD4756289.1 deoxynucleoside kinase [Prolixibacteraceae bacterium]